MNLINLITRIHSACKLFPLDDAQPSDQTLICLSFPEEGNMFLRFIYH